MPRAIYPLRVWATTQEEAVAEVIKALSKKGLTPSETPRPWPLPKSLQYKIGVIWYECRVWIEVPA